MGYTGNFVYDYAYLSGSKQDLNALTVEDPNKYVTADNDWNPAMQAIGEVRRAIISGSYVGFAHVSGGTNNTTPFGLSGSRNWVFLSGSGDLYFHKQGVGDAVFLTGSVKLSQSYAAAATQADNVLILDSTRGFVKVTAPAAYGTGSANPGIVFATELTSSATGIAKIPTALNFYGRGWNANVNQDVGVSASLRVHIGAGSTGHQQEFVFAANNSYSNVPASSSFSDFLRIRPWHFGTETVDGFRLMSADESNQFYGGPNLGIAMVRGTNAFSCGANYINTWSLAAGGTLLMNWDTGSQRPDTDLAADLGRSDKRFRNLNVRDAAIHHSLAVSSSYGVPTVRLNPTIWTSPLGYGTIGISGSDEAGFITISTGTASNGVNLVESNNWLFEVTLSRGYPISGAFQIQLFPRNWYAANAWNQYVFNFGWYAQPMTGSNGAPLADKWGVYATSTGAPFSVISSDYIFQYATKGWV